MPFFEFNLHRQGAFWRNPLLQGVLCILFLGFGGMVACKNNATDRYAYHVARARGIFGINQRVTVTASPGLVAACDESSDTVSACVRAGSPFPRIRIANGDIDAKEAVVRVSNVNQEPYWNVYLEPLLPDEAQDQRCARDALGPPPETSMRLGDEQGGTLYAHLPACAALVYVGNASPAHAQQAYRVAVLGGINMRESELRVFMQRLSQRSARIDYVYIIGDVSIRNRRDPLETLDNIMETYDLPWTVVLSPTRAQRGFEPLVNHIGSLDYHVRIFGMPLIVIDTASARISNTQRQFFQKLRQCEPQQCAPAAAIMSIPPVSLHAFEVGTFRSQIVAQELLNMLRGAGMQALVSSIEKSMSATRFSGVELFDVGTEQNTEDFLELTFVPSAPDAQLCDGWLAIAEDANWTVSTPYSDCQEHEGCSLGICLESCTADDDCITPGTQCDPRGFCRVPCREQVCDSGVCGVDGFCNERPRLYAQERSL